MRDTLPRSEPEHPADNHRRRESVRLLPWCGPDETYRTGQHMILRRHYRNPENVFLILFKERSFHVGYIHDEPQEEPLPGQCSCTTSTRLLLLPIDNPAFVSPDEADKWIKDNELVLVINYRGVQRVYPFQILVWHEIVNDRIAVDPVLITYCPLCGSGIAYSRSIDGEAVTFGTTGKLYNSNLVMYDRKTNTYWSQIDGRAIYGKLTGEKLKPLPVDTVIWGNWKKYHKKFSVLDRKTGYSRPYGNDPYGNYYTADTLFFPVENESSSLHPKAVIYGIDVEGIYKAYPDSSLMAGETVFDNIVGKLFYYFRHIFMCYGGYIFKFKP